MMTRRPFVRQDLATSTSMLLTGMTGFSSSQLARTIENHRRQMPDEGAPYAATWMAFGTSVEIWEPHLLPAVQGNLALVAKTVATFEPVGILVCGGNSELATCLCGSSVNLLVRPIDGLWIRDTGPVFVRSASGAPDGVGFNLNGWGNKQERERNADVAEFVIDYVQAEFTYSALTLEDGGTEVDGEGTAIITGSCVPNSDRNPGISKAEYEEELKRLLGPEKIIWSPGTASEDITDGHIDFYARFMHPSTVVAGLEQNPLSFDYAIIRCHLDTLRVVMDVRGQRLKVVTLEGPSTIRQTYANDDSTVGYINFYLCDDAVIAPQPGDKRTDRNAHAILQELFTGREIIQLNINSIIAGGGGIHCATQQ